MKLPSPADGPVLPDTAIPDLVDAARRGNRAAMRALYERFAPAVHGCLLAHVRPQDAEDLLHDTFASAFARLATLREPAAFPGWILRIARNLAIDHLRTPHTSDDGLDQVESTASPPDAVADARRVLAALARVPERLREVLAMRLVEGMSGPEIAEATGLTHGTVRVYLHEGMQQLRALLGDAAEAPGRAG